MKIFGKQRESLRIRKTKSSRALFEGHLGEQEIHIELQTDEGDILTLQMRPIDVPKLITELTTSYEAINPPLRRGINAADWQGME